MRHDIDFVLDRLGALRAEGIWPNGKRYLWTDAFGLVLLVSLYHELGEERWLDEARDLVSEVERVLGRPRGLRIGEDPERDGQYFHYLAMWVFALDRLGRVEPAYRERAIELVREVHPRFVRPGDGVYWKMTEDLSAPYPGFGYGVLDPFHGMVAYRLLAPEELAGEIADMEALVEASVRKLHVTQDLGGGMMLWLSHFFPDERWATLQRHRSLTCLSDLWVDSAGYFSRRPGLRDLKFAFSNYGIAIGLQAIGVWPERVDALLETFRDHRSGDEYDDDPITHVMACSAHFPGELLGQAAIPEGADDTAGEAPRESGRPAALAALMRALRL